LLKRAKEKMTDNTESFGAPFVKRCYGEMTDYDKYNSRKLKFAKIVCTKPDKRNVFATVNNDKNLYYEPYKNKYIFVDWPEKNLIGHKMEHDLLTAKESSERQSMNPHFYPKCTSHLFDKDEFCKKGGAANSNPKYYTVDDLKKSQADTNTMRCLSSIQERDTLGGITLYKMHQKPENMRTYEHFLNLDVDEEDFLGNRFEQPVKHLHTFSHSQGNRAFDKESTQISCQPRQVLMDW
jgi:hypothetical protein